MKRSSPAPAADTGAALASARPTPAKRAKAQPAALTPLQPLQAEPAPAARQALQAEAAMPAAQTQRPQDTPQTQAQGLPPQAAPPADAATSPAAAGAALSREERIRQAAYARYEQRNGAPGDEHADWLEAEAHLNRTDPDPAVWAP